MDNVHFIVMHHQDSDYFHSSLLRLPYTKPLNLPSSVWINLNLFSFTINCWFFKLDFCGSNLIVVVQAQWSFFKIDQAFPNSINKESQTWATCFKNSLQPVWIYAVFQLKCKLADLKWLASCDKSKWVEVGYWNGFSSLRPLNVLYTHCTKQIH